MKQRDLRRPQAAKTFADRAGALITMDALHDTAQAVLDRRAANYVITVKAEAHHAVQVAQEAALDARPRRSLGVGDR